MTIWYLSLYICIHIYIYIHMHMHKYIYIYMYIYIIELDVVVALPVSCVILSWSHECVCVSVCAWWCFPWLCLLRSISCRRPWSPRSSRKPAARKYVFSGEDVVMVTCWGLEILVCHVWFVYLARSMDRIQAARSAAEIVAGLIRTFLIMGFCNTTHVRHEVRNKLYILKTNSSYIKGWFVNKSNSSYKSQVLGRHDIVLSNHHIVSNMEYIRVQIIIHLNIYIYS